VRESTWDWRTYRGLLKAQVSPFLKWAGGKSQLLEYMKFPTRYAAYHEPFLGGGAVFFGLQARPAYLSDANEDLVNTYSVVKGNVEQLIPALREMEKEYSENTYYEIRSQNPGSLDSVNRAARFIFLNKTCYNGLYRVNKDGEFNVPFGRYKKPNICDENVLRSASEVLQSTVVRTCDFREGLEKVRIGDFVYMDPPYVPVSTTSRFTEYTNRSFDWSDHQALARQAQRIGEEIGCYVLISNSFQQRVKQLYEDFGFIVRRVRANRTIASRPASRKRIDELLISNY